MVASSSFLRVGELRLICLGVLGLSRGLVAVGVGAGPVLNVC
jgi:hypothetical protein